MLLLILSFKLSEGIEQLDKLEDDLYIFTLSIIKSNLLYLDLLSGVCFPATIYSYWSMWILKSLMLNAKADFIS